MITQTAYAQSTLVESGVIYRNPKPHLVARHAYFPSIVEVSPGELVAGFDLGTAFEAVDVRSFAARSTDGGRTWSAPQQVFSPEGAVSTSCRLARTGEREISGLACVMDRSRIDEGLANPATDGFVKTRFAIVRSSDGGKTFSAPESVKPPIDWHYFEVCSPVVVTPSGRWLAPTAIWPDWDGNDPHGPKALVLVSDDHGKTWPRAVDVMNRRNDRIGFFEQKIVTLSDGRLMALCWTVDLKSKSNLSNHIAFSSDDGDTFSSPVATPIRGETCTPVALDDNHVLLVYRRVDKKGLWAVLARVGEKNLEIVHELPLWGANVDSHDTTHQSLLAQMSTLRFGCPTVTRLADGSIFAAFWCVEDSVSNIRWLKISVI